MILTMQFWTTMCPRTVQPEGSTHQRFLAEQPYVSAALNNGCRSPKEFM